MYLDDKIYPSTENAYQASKTIVEFERRAFTKYTPGQAKRAGRKVTLRPDWDEVNLGIMLDLQIQKFDNPKFKELLLQTEDCLIVEGNSWNDTFWGIYEGKGENNLGKLIMLVRSSLKVS